MVSTPTTRLRLELQAQGDNLLTWGDVANAVFQRIEEAVAGEFALVTTGGTRTLSTANFTSDEARMARVHVSGALTSNAIVVVPAVDKQYQIVNATTGAFTLTVKTASVAGVTVPQGSTAPVYVRADGTVGLGGAPAKADGTIDGSIISAGTISAGSLAAGAAASNIGAGGVTSAMLAAGAAAANIGAGGVTNAMLAADSVDSSKILDGSIATADLGANSVTNPKLAQMANATVKGRNTAGTGDPEDVTMAQLAALLVADAAAVTSLQGISPSLGGSSINALADVDTLTTPPTTGQSLLWNGTNWVPGAGGATFTSSATAPASPALKDLWYDTTNDILFVRVNDGGGAIWLDISTAGGGGSMFTSAATPPATPNDGDYWYDTANDVLYVRVLDGGGTHLWLDVSSPGSASIADGSVTNAKFATAAAYTFKGNNAAAVATPTDMTADQALATLAQATVNGANAESLVSVLNRSQPLASPATTGSITIDLATGQVVPIAISGALTLNAFSNGQAGTPVVIDITNGSGSSQTLAVNTTNIKVGTLTIPSAVANGGGVTISGIMTSATVLRVTGVNTY